MPHLSLEEAKIKLCQQAWELSEPCDPNLLTQLYRPDRQLPLSSSHDPTDKNNSAPVLYIVIVAVFYLCIVAVLVGSNAKKTKKDDEEKKSDEKTQVLEYVEGRGTQCRLVDFNEDEDDDLNSPPPIPTGIVTV